MPLYFYLIIGICILDLFLGIVSFYVADNKGQDPMSAFIATMLFSVLGFMFAMMMSDRNASNAKTKISSDEDSDEKLVKSVLIEWDKKLKAYLMLINNNVVDSNHYGKVLETPDVRYYLQDIDGSVREIKIDEAKKLLKIKSNL